MKRSWTTCSLALAIAVLLAAPIAAEVKTRERSLVKLEGMLGRIVGIFGGKAARDGIISTSAVKGDRKLTVNDNTGQLIDLREEKLYEIDFKKKTYQVTTFDELRRRIKEEQERAAREAQKAEREERREPEQAPEKQEPRKEFEVDFKIDETGQKKQIAGYDARQVIMTVTLREKGKTLDESGGFVMTADTWFGPEVKALEELAEFDTRYYEKLYGTQSVGLSADQMAMVMAMYPMLKDASERLAKEGKDVSGTPLATTTMFEVVKSKAQLEAETSEQQSSGGGVGGLLARRVMKKSEPKARATVFTVQHEYQEVATNVAASDLEIPAGFKEKK